MALGLDDVEKTSRFNTYSSLVKDNVDKFSIYPHQRDALKALQSWYNNQESRIGLVVIPTGGGKSGIAALAPYILNTTRVLVITPSVQITNQLAEAFGKRPKESFYVTRKVVTEEAANKFVEPLRVIQQVKEIEDHAENLVIVNAQKFGTNSKVDWDKLNPKSFNLLIVDEAHHFPAPTWDKIVSYFNCRTIFLTATPYRNGEPILPGQICYQITPNELMNNGIIRRTIFQQIGNDQDSGPERRTLLSAEILKILDEHDRQDPSVKHQAMVLTKDKEEAKQFTKQLKLTAKQDIAESYTGDTKSPDSILQKFENAQIRVLVVCGKLLEGYDRKQISVCAIVRRVAPKSKVLFTQFVGRCLRKVRLDDPVDGRILSHVYYQQQKNYNNLNEVAEDDPDDNDE
ncbi:unnamed protein product [Adineta steineri]|uniref:Helicase ATP-binding domain-containing protein n=1 Tax=Adineta steineri TaxID=433720 RepID=A0A813X4Y6_9BILA|nr:unnamed protein product [Adineta steineri]CAF1394009.1 unnamed protein product [Adineta steineri]CAF1397676.1 unnamed protein product [Adineta steineri]